ncbi:MAG: hypothetical protein CVV07_03120 [Gammaproteobacteria bacterium HGW-Gammaproteobacteria-11]|nr:MAG: hypothetical protein CVV07_03120 [Gammaproteobacteria bacterium HGW-Gammaproteobacteria-11]
MLFRLTCLILSLYCITPAQAAPETDPQTTTLDFLVADVWPWGYINAAGEQDGLIVNFVRRFAAEAELPYSVRILPHQRVLSELQRGQPGLAMLFENPYLDDYAISLGVVLNTDILLIRKHGDSQPPSLAALAGKPVGYIRGTYYGEAFEHDQQIIKIPVNNLDQAIDMLRLGRLDAMMSSDVVFLHTLAALGLKPADYQSVVTSAGHPAHLYQSAQQTDSALTRRLQQHLQTLHDSGELLELFYLPQADEERLIIE